MAHSLWNLPAVCWAIAPFFFARGLPDAGAERAKGRIILYVAWTLCGAALASLAATAPHGSWWAAWIGGVWFFEFEHRAARAGLRNISDRPVDELGHQTRPLQESCRSLKARIANLQSTVSSCGGRYLAMKDFHKALRPGDLAQAIVDKIMKLTGADAAAIRIRDADGRAMAEAATDSKKIDGILESANWIRDEVVEGMTVRMAVAGHAPDHTLQQLYLPLPALWRRSILYARVEELAVIDRLTGLGVRRIFDERLIREISLSAETGRPLSLVMIDVDHFKRFNDTFGHLVGDRVLAAIARAISGQIRNTDFAARYGGEEMALILPETPLAAALSIAERVRSVIESHRVPHGSDSLAVTASFGVAERMESESSAESLIRHADAGLYAAKSAGRNRVSTDPASAERRAL
jgi:diguanylate cyclase (GGDEF)-like protein